MSPRLLPRRSWLAFVSVFVPVLLAVASTGCVQVEEDLSLEADGSGTYDLQLVWDAGLLKRLVDWVGPRAAAPFRGRDLPLTRAAWQDGLDGLEGVTVRALTLEEGEGGRRTLRVQLRFRHLSDLLGWEVFARRGLTIRRVEVEDGPPRAELVMTPLTRIPYLDPLLAARAARRSAPVEETGAAPELDPPPFERLGIPPHRADLAETLLGPALRDVRLAFRVRPPGALGRLGPGGKATAHGALFTWDFDALEAGRERGILLSWEPRPFDPIPEIDHEGDRPAAAVPSR